MASDAASREPDELALRAESVWLEAVEGGAGAAPDVQSLCRLHPELAAHLREIEGDWGWLEGRVVSGGDRKGEPPLELRKLARGLDQERYTRIEEIDKGGGGRIERIWDSLLRRSLAMKVANTRVRGDRASRSRRLARFLEEAQVTGQLQHPGIVPVHDVGIDEDGFAFFTMDLVEGMELGEAFRRARVGDPEWSLQRAVRALASVAETLAYAHDRGVLHRDVKPSNVMVGPFGEVYVMDWGLARIEGGEGVHDVQSVRSSSSTSALVTAEGVVMGTPTYMSPEQARGRLTDLDERADVYALGAMLYELLAGRPPYVQRPASTPEELAHEVARSAPPPLHELAPDAPPELVAIAERAMARNREDRYGDMSSVAQDLRAFLEGRVVHAHRTGALVQIEKWILRNRLSAAALFLLIGALATTAWIQYDHGRVLRSINQELNVTNEDLEKARTAALGEAHFARLAAAQASLRAGNGRSAENHLEACPPELRGWGWRHLRARTVNDEARHEIQPGFAAPAAFDRSADGRFAVGQNLRIPELEYGTSYVSELILYGLEGDTERVLLEIPGAIVVRSIPATSLFVTATREGLKVIDCEQGGATVAEADSPLDGLTSVLLAVSEDGGRMVHGTQEGHFEVRDPRDLRRIEIWEPEPEIHSQSAIALSPRGDLLACLDGEGTLHLIAAGGAVVASIETGAMDRTAYAPPLAFRADGSLLAVGGSGGTLELFQVPSGTHVASIPAFEENIGAVAFAPSGKSIAGGSWTGTVSVFDVASRTAIFRGYGHQGMVIGLGWERDGDELWSASRDGTLRTWRPERGNGFDPLRTRGGSDLDLIVDPRRERVATTNTEGVLRLWDTRTGDLIGSRDYSWIRRFAPIEGAFVPPSGDLVVSTRYSGLMRFQADTLELEAEADPGGGDLLTIDENGRRMAYDENGEARVVRVEDLSLEARLPGIANPTAFAFCSHGERLWVGTMRGLSSWLLEGDSPVRIQSLVFDAGVVALATDGQRLAVGLTDGRIELRSLEDGALITELGQNPGPVENLDFHPFEPLLVSSGSTSAGDVSLRLWDTEALQLRCELMGPEERLRSAAFGWDGSWIVARSASSNGYVLIDDGPRYRGSAMVEVARERVRARVEALYEEWPHPNAFALVWDAQPSLDPHEYRAGRNMGFERVVDWSSCLRALERLAVEHDQVGKYPEASVVLARHVSSLSDELRPRMTAARVLLLAGHADEAFDVFQAFESALPLADFQTELAAEKLARDIDSALGH